MLHTPPMSTMAALDVGGEREPHSPHSPHPHSPLTPSGEEYYDDEPDEEWKTARREMIADSFQEMIQEAKARLERKLQSLRGAEGMDDAEREAEKDFLVEEFQGETAVIKALAKDEFQHALTRERLMRRLRRDSPPRTPTTAGAGMGTGTAGKTNHEQQQPNPTINNQSLRLDLEQEQAATLKATNANVEAAFQNLIKPTDSDAPTAESKEKLDKGKNFNPDAGALAIKITRLPAEPAVNGNVGWVKASDAARKHDLAVRQSKTEAAQIAAPPPPPQKKWVSASDAARRTTQRRIE